MPPDVDLFLAQVRAAYAPDPEAKTHVRRTLAAAALLSSATVASQSALAKTLAAKAGGIGFGVALAGLGSATVLVGAMSFSGLTPPWHSPPAMLAGAELDEIARTGSAAQQAVSREADRAQPLLAPVELSPMEEATPDVEPPVPSTPRATATQKEASRELIEELRLIRTATQSLREGETPAARTALDEHRTRFPNGKLAIERRGLYVLVQCAAGKSPHAKEAAEAFLKASPRSPLAGHVRDDCFE